MFNLNASEPSGAIRTAQSPFIKPDFFHP